MSSIMVAGVVSVRVACRVEVFPIPFRPSERRAGGISIRLDSTGWTIARTVQRLGGDMTLATYVGADPLGQLTIQGLRDCGLYGPTTLVCDEQPRTMVLYDRCGRRSSTRDLRTAPDLRYPAGVFAAAVTAGSSGCDLAVLTNVGFTRSLIDEAAMRRIPVATDVHLVDRVDDPKNQDWMRVAHVLACSHERLPAGPVDWTRELWRRFGTDIVLVGCGSRGAVLGLRSPGRIWHIAPAVPRGVTYTSGAGDVLLASFAHHYVDTGDPLDAARAAVLTAGWHVGGGPDDEPGTTTDQLRVVRESHGLPSVRRLL